MDFEDVNKQVAKYYLSVKFAEMIQSAQDHFLEFTAHVVKDIPNCCAICMEHGKKIILISCAYSDDEEFMNQVTDKVDKLLTDEFQKRYPTMLQHIVEDNRDGKN